MKNEFSKIAILRSDKNKLDQLLQKQGGKLYELIAEMIRVYEFAKKLKFTDMEYPQRKY